MRNQLGRVMQQVADKYGCISFAWVADGVLYARFEKKISAMVGERFGARLAELAQKVDCLSYFADSHAMTEYDMLARSAIVRAIMANRRRFAALVILTGARGVGPTARMFADALGGSVEYLSQVEEFELRLLAVAPFALQALEGPARSVRKSPRQ